MGTSSPASWHSLSPELKVRVLQHVTPTDLLNFQYVAKAEADLSMDDHVWHTALHSYPWVSTEAVDVISKFSLRPPHDASTPRDGRAVFRAAQACERIAAKDTAAALKDAERDLELTLRLPDWQWWDIEDQGIRIVRLVDRLEKLTANVPCSRAVTPKGGGETQKSSRQQIVRAALNRVVNSLFQ